MSEQKDSTLAALLREKRTRRGRPRHAVSRQNVYVALTPEQKAIMKRLAEVLPECVQRADIPDLAITLLTVHLEALRRSVAGRNREMPEGITDIGALYLLWDLALPESTAEARWTTIRVSPQQGIDLGRDHGGLHALFGASRSDVFGLGLALLEQAADPEWVREWSGDSLAAFQSALTSRFL